jgi:2-keto-3-deoxy-L-rhamnonate aldolase RhmA/quercetin dioxygenase-like cupin family protein
MKSSAIKRLKRKLAAGETTVGFWVTLESPSITEMAVAIGIDWIVIDAEHGHLDWNEVVDHIRATVRSDTVALVRLTEANAALVKRALDIGADGIIIPWVETAEQLRQIVAFAHYPPNGVRGIGAERATAWGQCLVEHVEEAGENVLVLPMIESVRGGQNIGEMLAVDGVDLFYFGPADYSSSAGYAGQWQGPGVAEQLLEIKNQITAAGKYCGVIATNDANFFERQAQGFRMICLGSDAGFLLRGLHTTLAAIGRDRKLNTALIPGSQPIAASPLDRPPEHFRPDRREVINEVGQGAKREIQPGVVFECLVGEHNGARNLTTGIVTVSPKTQLAYHTHPTSESITLLEGAGVVEVEGRRYNLSPLDNVVVPRGVAHSVMNASPDGNARFQIAFPTATPARELVEPTFERRQMPDDSTGTPGRERVTRFATAHRFKEGHGATFIDFFNCDLVPQIEMSGGYGLFCPGDRLPAHIHDFDESICIIDGTATCVVEGREYSMDGCTTALQPRGRVHYFVNKSDGPMAMLWVYAGPNPERIVVDERNATAVGAPWQ